MAYLTAKSAAMAAKFGTYDDAAIAETAFPAAAPASPYADVAEEDPCLELVSQSQPGGQVQSLYAEAASNPYAEVPEDAYAELEALTGLGSDAYAEPSPVKASMSTCEYAFKTNEISTI